MAEFEDLRGKIIANIRIDRNDFGNDGDDAIHFELTTGQEFVMFHSQVCCESVYVDEIIGDIDDILDKEILQAEESSNKNETPEGIPAPEVESWESYTWTFYRLNTIDSTLVIRWCGESNGYYSEGVDFDEVESEEPKEEPYNDTGRLWAKIDKAASEGRLWAKIDKAASEEMQRMVDAQGYLPPSGIDGSWLNKYFTEDFLRLALKKMVTSPPGVPFCGAFRVGKK